MLGCIDDCFGPPKPQVVVEPHYTTATIWSVLFYNREPRRINPAAPWDGLIGVTPPPMVFPKVLKSFTPISANDIVSAQPMAMTGSSLFQFKYEYKEPKANGKNQ